MTRPVTLSLDALRASLRDNAFGFRRKAPRPPTIGAEVELIPVETDTRRRVPVCAPPGEPCTLPLLRRFGAAHGWREEASPYGAPRFATPDGGVVSYEPGGQIEFSAAPNRSASGLLASLRGFVLPLKSFFGDHGIDLLSIGIDPVSALDDVPLQLPGARYARMTAFLEAMGTGGVRMMRQTAAFQVSLDWGAAPLETWRFLNAAAPYLLAVFANSPVYGGAETGERSFRARVWRELGGGRTGIFPCAADPVGEYLGFALDAPAILLEGADHEWRSFRDWLAGGGVSMDDWETHLSTLFPEVRPKGFVEVRSIDALPPEWYAAPLVLLAGCAYHPGSFAEAAALVGRPDVDLLDRAGRLGLSDPRIASVAGDLWEIALAGAAALGPAFIAPGDLEEARAFRDTYTRHALSPADDVSSPPATTRPVIIPSEEPESVSV